MILEVYEVIKYTPSEFFALYSTQTHVTDRRFSVCLIIATCILNNFYLKTIHLLTLACCIRHV